VLYLIKHSCADIPIIYADGIRDDTAGWVAAVQNQRVMYDGKIYEPDENITINREMKFERNICSLGEEYDLPAAVDDTWIVARIPSGAKREIYYLNRNVATPIDSFSRLRRYRRR